MGLGVGLQLGLLPLLIILLLQVPPSESQGPLPPSQLHSLVRLHKLVGLPLSNNSDLCYAPSSPSVNISCSTSSPSSVISIYILGQAPSRISPDFSTDTLGNILSAFPDLQLLSLVNLGLPGPLPAKLDHLPSLRLLNLSQNLFSGPLPDRFRSLRMLNALILQNNRLTGSVPDWLSSLPSLTELDLSHNGLTGSFPASLFLPTKLQRISISHNGLSGSLPDLSSGSVLEYLNLGANHLGPRLPHLANGRLQVVLLGQNDFSDSIPRGMLSEIRAVSVLDLSYNSLYGNPPVGIFKLESLQTLALNGNQLSGALPFNLSLSPSLKVVDISSNLFTGRVPASFLNHTGVVIRYGKNCLVTRLQQQYTRSHCVRARKEESGPDSHDLEIIAGIIGGGIALVGAILLFLCVLIRCLKQQRKSEKIQYAASSCADTASVGVPSDLLSNARYLSQSIRLGVHTSAHGRVFSVPELEEATGNFSVSNLVGEGQHGKVYKGKLSDGSVIAVKCLTLDPRQDLRQLKVHLEMLVKIRHRHLVGYLGYSLDREPENGGQNRRLFLVSEFLDSGNLRQHISKTEGKASLNWSQRLAAVIGAGRGIQYLHTGVVPGIFNNDVNIFNILMDQNCVAKFTDFGVGRHARTSCDFDAKVFVQKTPAHIDLDHHRRKLASDKSDVYNFGFVLMEIVIGRPPTIDDSNSLHPKVRELEMLLTEHVPRYEVVDTAIVGTCVSESLTTVLEIAAKCLSEEASSRPSMEDVLWNLQYAAQVQDRVSGEYTEELPYVSPPRSRFNRQAIRTSSISRQGGTRDETGPESSR